MGFLDRLKAKAKAKLKKAGASSVQKVRDKNNSAVRKKGTGTASSKVDKAFKNGNTIGKTGAQFRKKKSK